MFVIDLKVTKLCRGKLLCRILLKSECVLDPIVSHLEKIVELLYCVFFCGGLVPYLLFINHNLLKHNCENNICNLVALNMLLM